MKQYLDKEQAQQLVDLGVDMSSTLMSHRGKLVHYNPMTWEWDVITGCFCGKPLDRWYIPTLSLGELIERLPIMIDPSDGKYQSCPHERTIAQNAVMYMCPTNSYGYAIIYKHASKGALIDNLFNCYVQLITDGIIKL